VLRRQNGTVRYWKCPNTCRCRVYGLRRRAGYASTYRDPNLDRPADPKSTTSVRPRNPDRGRFGALVVESGHSPILTA
jgi:hypothetical protein